ncbi:hypothetical protein BKA69DRAFT_1100752 [Paraphysoderma sedebokerense]|nr:hypothetical protein BKA69DRAFT_1100752 [Paraphysoderma sedebokerense]
MKSFAIFLIASVLALASAVPADIEKLAPPSVLKLVASSNGQSFVPLGVEPFRPCASLSAITVNDLALSPYPPKAGQTLNIGYSGSLNSGTVGTSAFVKVKVQKFGVTLLTQEVNVCNTLTGGRSCPVNAGDTVAGAFGIDIAGGAPKLNYDIVIELIQDNQKLLCLTGGIALQ